MSTNEMNELQEMRAQLAGMEAAQSEHLLQMQILACVEKISLASIEALRDVCEKVQSEAILSPMVALLNQAALNAAMLDKMMVREVRAFTIEPRGGRAYLPVSEVGVETDADPPNWAKQGRRLAGSNSALAK